jgi:hypothetical protein
MREETRESQEVRPRQQEDGQMIECSRRIATAVSLAVVAVAALGLGASPALAESHPKIGEFGSFSNPNGIAIDESTSDVYVADIATTSAVYRFDASGTPVNFTCGAPCSAYVKGNEITGTPAGSFAFPELAHTPAALAVDNSTSLSDPSRGDVYVMDAGHGAIDKFNSEGKYLSQITGFEPATGSAGVELLGLAVDASGTVRAELSGLPESFFENAKYEAGPAVEEFDDSAANNLIAHQTNGKATNHMSGIPAYRSEADGFAVGPTGDDYMIFGTKECSCTAKLGQQLAGLGLLDDYRSGDVAIAADPASGHVYVDDASSVAEWDAGALNGSPEKRENGGYQGENEGEGVLVSRFGSAQLSGTSGKGGIAVDGASGDIYVSNPANGKVYVFASEAPAVTAGTASDITQRSATLNGTVNPRGRTATSCEFEYGVADGFGRAKYEHKAPCNKTPAEIGSATGPVAVSADIGSPEPLEPGLLYRFRLVAGDSAGSGESAGLLAAQGPPFGIKNFEVSFLNEDGTPDTQAGSHPYELVNNIEYNWHYVPMESNADSIYAREPAGTPRDYKIDLPPGLAGDPNATAKRCELNQLFNETGFNVEHHEGGCPPESMLGTFEVNWDPHVFGYNGLRKALYNMLTPRGTALQLGTDYVGTDVFLDNTLLAGGDYPVQTTLEGVPAEAPVLRSRVTVSGVLTPCVRRGPGQGKYGDVFCLKEAVAGQGEFEREPSASKALLTLPTGCHGPLRSTIEIDSYEKPGEWAHAENVTRNAAGTPVSLTGCSKLIFPPTISVKPDTTNASTSSGLTVSVHVPQNAAFNPAGLAESSLRDTTVALPQGVSINPAGAEGLQACSEGLAGFKGFSEFNPNAEPGVEWNTFTPTLVEQLQPGVSFCPDGSKIGTVKVKTPLLEHELEGTVYLASQNANPFGGLVAMYLVAEDPFSGSVIKLAGEVHLTATGQIVTTFKNTPDLPFENLELHFFGGERAPLATPSRCGTYTTTAVFTPWDGNGPVTSESSFNIEHGPGGGPCPGASLPFDPSLTGGATNVNAGAFSPFTLTMTRKNGEQNLQSAEAHLPPGLLGILSNIELCGEPQANLGECGPNSLIGETTVSVGVGNQPYTVSGGKFYLTGPYNGTGPCSVGQSGCAPFGITFEVPAKAGPFDLKRNSANPAGEDPCDCVIVRGKIEVDPITAAITITSNPPGTPYAIPTSIEGIPLEIQHVNAITTRSDFQFNPTNCNKMQVSGTIHSSEGSTDTIAVPFQVTNCAVLGFKPQFTVSTAGKTSRANGASLNVKLTYPKAPFGSQANIKSVKVDLPKQLPSRLTTLQKACPAKTFEANPAGCPADSIVGHATAITPLIPVPLTGPAYFVSYGGAKFPELVIVLQGYDVTLDLHGETFISKAGITSSTFHTVPDAPVGSFELNLPEGKYSALAANGNLCSATRTILVKKRVEVRSKGRTRIVTRKVPKTVSAGLVMPTAFTAQNGAVIKQSTPIGVTGCAKHKKAKAGTRHKAGKHKKR